MKESPCTTQQWKWTTEKMQMYRLLFLLLPQKLTIIPLGNFSVICSEAHLCCSLWKSFLPCPWLAAVYSCSPDFTSPKRKKSGVMIQNFCCFSALWNLCLRPQFKSLPSPVRWLFHIASTSKILPISGLFHLCNKNFFISCVNANRTLFLAWLSTIYQIKLN